jgi:hypothetical protein
MPRRRVDRRGGTLVLVVLLALGFGVVAAFIASPSQATPGSPSNHPYQPVPAIIFVLVLAIGVPTFVAIWIINLVLTRIRDGNTVPTTAAVVALVTFLVIALVLVGLLALAGVFHHLGPGTEPAPTNSTGTGSSGGGGTGVNGSCKNCTGNATGPPITYPTWALGGIALVGVALAGLLALVYFVALRQAPGGDGSEDPREAVRREFRRALQKLAESDPEDPREIILALYARLLLRLQPRVASTEPLTPREIERVLVDALGIRAAPAQQLTRIFEEARYSHRPVAAGTVELTREALQQVLTDLGGVAPSTTFPVAARPER